MFHKLLNKWMTKTGLYFIVFVIQIITVPILHVPIMTDAINPLALGFMSRGDDWSRYLIADGYYYKYGQLFVYFPFIYCIRNNVILYQILLTVNIAMVSLIPICVFQILAKYLKCTDIEKMYIISLLTGLLPIITLNCKYTWAEPILMLLPWLILLLLLESMQDECSKTRGYINSLLLAVLQVYAYMVHTRGIVILIATVVCTCLIRFVFKKRTISLCFYLLITFLLLVLDKVISTLFRNIMYGKIKGLAGGTLNFLTREFMEHLFSCKGLQVWGEEILGWLFASVVSTFGLTSLGLVVSITVLFHFRQWRKINNQELMIIIFSILSFLGALVLGTIFFFHDLYFADSMEIVSRGDKLIYARYLNGACVCICFIGLYFYFINKKAWMKTQSFYSAVFFLLLYGFFISVIAKRVDDTITWTHILITINYFCDLNQCIRGGLHSTVGFLSGGIALFSLFVFLFFGILLSLRNKKHFFVCCLIVFLAGYGWNTYNVIYRADKYIVKLIKNYDDIIRSVRGEEELSNLYLDDEILRCGFQYYFADYYVLTKRDQNRNNVQNMFMISPNTKYNEELYDDDYFEVLDLNSESLDYHLYIKGDMLNEQLQSKGYVTKEITDLNK